MSAIYKIEYWALGKLNATIERYNRRAIKLAQKPLEFDVVTKIEIDKDGDEHRWLEVSFTGDPAKVGGWEFVGTVQHTETGNLLRSVPGRPEIPEVFRTVSPHCGHCDKNRVRKDTYVLNQGENFKQVGKNCLRDFLGHDPSIALALMDMIRECNDADSESFSMGKLSAQPADVCAMAAAIANNIGWNKENAANVWNYLFPRGDFAREMQKGRIPRIVVTPADVELAETAMDWVRVSQKNNFLSNIEATLNMKAVGWREYKICAWAVGAYLKDMESEKLAQTKAQIKRDQVLKRKEQFAQSKHIGVIGERIKARLVMLQSIKVGSSMNNCDVPLVLYKMQTEDGNVVTWLTAVHVSVDDGQTFEAKFTIKGHRTYEDVLETSVSRITINTSSLS
jgi:hypothetical protein